jgi:hypothetical protein
MSMRMRCCTLACLFLCVHGAVWPGYKDDIGYSRLVAEQGANTPDGSGIPVSQAEAATAFVPIPPSTDPGYPVYLPNVADSQFSGKTISAQSGTESGQYSGHATSVGTSFYGNTSSIVPGIKEIEAYWADHWLQGGFLRYGYGSDKPLVSASRIANHSWIADIDGTDIDSELLRRTDWLIDTDEYIQCVGIRNGVGPNSPLLSGAYNAIVVGRSDGLNGYGTAQLDADYVAGRIRPELVAPRSTTSSATPVVAAGTALLLELGHNTPSLSTDPVAISTSNRNGDAIYNAERSETIKAVLMAGADRQTDANTAAPDITDYRVDPANQSANGLDTRFGAGQVNIYNSFHILNAGEQNSDEDFGGGLIGVQGFDYDPSFGGSRGSNATASYYFSTGSQQVMLAATLAWNIRIRLGNGPRFNSVAELHDLDLYLYDVTAGQALTASSTSTIDNTETLWMTLPANRDYLLRVVPKAGHDAFDWDYALAWRMVDLADTDGDGLPDVIDDDDDDDGLLDIEELNIHGTEPLVWDTDGDGYGDGEEIIAGTNPLDDSSYPALADGDVNGDGLVDVRDVLLATRIATGELMPTEPQRQRGDVAPLVGGVPAPNGVMDTGDLLLIQRKALGLAVF